MAQNRSHLLFGEYQFKVNDQDNRSMAIEITVMFLLLIYVITVKCVKFFRANQKKSPRGVL